MCDHNNAMHLYCWSDDVMTSDNNCYLRLATTAANITEDNNYLQVTITASTLIATEMDKSTTSSVGLDLSENKNEATYFDLIKNESEAV